MNFEELISLAKSNVDNKKSKSSYYYPAKLAPPKKETWKSQMKSWPCNVVKKYLANAEVKEQVNVLKREDYKKKYSSSLKNAAASAENDNNNNSTNYEDFAQPDEDDWGFVGEEHNAQYNSILEMYRKLPPEKPLFVPEKEKPAPDIVFTKEKVKKALERQKEEESKKKKKRRSKKADTTCIDTSVASMDISELLNKVVKQQIDKIKDGQLFISDAPAENPNKAQVQTKLFVNESGKVRLKKNIARMNEYLDKDPIYTYPSQSMSGNIEKEEQEAESSNWDDSKKIFGEDFIAWAKKDAYSSGEAVLAALEDTDKENSENNKK